MNTELKEKDLTTSDLATAAETRTAQRERNVNEPPTENRNAEVITEDE